MGLRLFLSIEAAEKQRSFYGGFFEGSLHSSFFSPEVPQQKNSADPLVFLLFGAPFLAMHWATISEI